MFGANVTFALTCLSLHFKSKQYKICIKMFLQFQLTSFASDLLGELW